MEKEPSYLADDVLSDFFTNTNLKISHRRKQHKQRYPQVLESLDSQNYKPMVHSQSSMSLAEAKQHESLLNQQSQSAKLNSLKPLPVNDYHRVTDLMHRVSAVSGFTPDQSASAPSAPSSNVEIAANMPEFQLKAMKDSNSLREVMEKVILLHQELESIITTHLMHRKELGKQVEDVNNRYIKLFEVSLSEMLKTQRSKFKSQTQDIERIKGEMEELQGRFSAATKTIEHQSNKIIELQSSFYETDERLSIATAELYALRNYKSASERERLDFDNKLASALAEAKSEFEVRTKKMKMEHYQEVSAQQLKFAEERMKLSQKLEKSTLANDKLTKEVGTLKQKAVALDSLAASVEMRRPLRDNSCQTQATDVGLWDKQDGWIMPISQTARIRALWRAGMRFAACPACRGVGKYVHKVAAVLRTVKRGKELSKETIVEEDLSKWSLPDECVRFMSNLPKTAQAFRPRGLAWTVRCVFYLFALKYAADRQDDALGYNRQSFVEFVIERYLMSTEQRPDAELRMYILIRSVKEFYRRHPMLQLFARFMGILDDLTAEEYATINHQQILGEAALKRKRAEGMQSMGARERVKMLRDAEHQKEVDTVFKNPELDYPITNRAMGMDILSITLYARNCMLCAPYMGVYAVPIANAKRTNMMQQTQSHQLRSPTSDAFVADTIIPEVYHAEYIKMPNLTTHSVADLTAVKVLTPPIAPDASITESSEQAVRDPVPLHLCVGDRSQHWVPMDRAINVVRQLLCFLSTEEITTVYHEMECNTMFLMENGTLDLPEGTHSLIRATIRLFASCPLDGGFDLSWHDLYHSYSEVGNQNDYSSHFIKSLAAKEGAIIPVPQPIVVPIVGSLGNLEEKKGSVADDDSDDEGVRSAALTPPPAEDEEPELVVLRRLLYTRDPGMVFMDKKMTLDDYRAALFAQTSSNLLSLKVGWHELDTSQRSSSNKLIIQEELLGNHPHLKHYRHLHPDTMMVNLDVTLQIIAEAMLNRSAMVGVRIRQIFIEGDTNHDGVLSFSEFVDIVRKVAPEYHDRKILKMFREALMRGDDNECIGPDAFLDVCTSYGLVKILDINSYSLNELRALSDPPTVPGAALHNLHAERRHLQDALQNEKDKGSSAMNSPAARSSKKQSTNKFGHSTSDNKLLQLKRVDTNKSEKPAPSPTPAQAPVEKPVRRHEKVQKPVLSVHVNDETQYHLDEESDDSGDEMPSLAQFRTPQPIGSAALSGALRIAGMGGAVVLDPERPVDKSLEIPKPTPKGRVQSVHAVKQPSAPFQASLSTEGLCGTGTTLQARKGNIGTVGNAGNGSVSKPVAPRAASIVLDDEDEDEMLNFHAQQHATLQQEPASFVQGAGKAKQLHVALPQIPYMASSQPQSADMSQYDTAPAPLSNRAHPQGPTSGSSMRLMNAFAAEAQLAEVRNMKPNEVMSKQSSQRMMEQLKAKRDSRLNLS